MTNILLHIPLFSSMKFSHAWLDLLRTVQGKKIAAMYIQHFLSHLTNLVLSTCSPLNLSSSVIKLNSSCLRQFMRYSSQALVGLHLVWENLLIQILFSSLFGVAVFFLHTLSVRSKKINLVKLFQGVWYKKNDYTSL